MPYTPTDWVDNTTPVNAANMDKLEQGVVDAHAGLPPSPSGQDGKWLTVSGGAMVWQALPASGIQASIVDAKGDLIAASAADAVARLAVGSNGQVLTADSPSVLGVKWATPSADIAQAIVDAKGDLIAASAADTVARLGVGTDGQVLTAEAAQALGMKWATPAAGGGGGELAYVQSTSTVSITSTSESSPNDLLVFGAVAFDGSTAVVIEFHCGTCSWGSGGVSPSCYVNLWSGTTYPANIMGRIALSGHANMAPGTNPDVQIPMHGYIRLTPPASSIAYRIRASVTGAAPMNFLAGAGGAAGFTPMWARIVRA